MRFMKEQSQRIRELYQKNKLFVWCGLYYASIMYVILEMTWGDGSVDIMAALPPFLVTVLITIEIVEKVAYWALDKLGY